MGNRKGFTEYMAGMIRAQNVIGEDLKARDTEGFNKLTEEIRMRGFLKCPITISPAETDDYIEEICNNLYSTVLASALNVLQKYYGFGEKRLKDYKAYFDKETEAATDMNWAGNHYVTMTDYAESLNDLFGFDINLDVIEKCVKQSDLSNPDYKRIKLNRAVEELTKNGYGDAATFLLKEFEER